MTRRLKFRDVAALRELKATLIGSYFMDRAANGAYRSNLQSHLEDCKTKTMKGVLCQVKKDSSKRIKDVMLLLGFGLGQFSTTLSYK